MMSRNVLCYGEQIWKLNICSIGNFYTNALVQLTQLCAIVHLLLLR